MCLASRYTKMTKRRIWLYLTICCHPPPTFWTRGTHRKTHKATFVFEIAIWGSLYYFCGLYVFFTENQQRRRCHFRPICGGLVLVFTDNICVWQGVLWGRGRKRDARLALSDNLLSPITPPRWLTHRKTHTCCLLVCFPFFQHCFCKPQGQNSFATSP